MADSPCDSRGVPQLPYGFFFSRKPVDLGVAFSAVEFLSYQNVPQSVGVVVSSGLATLHELQTVYGVEDLYNLLEIVAIDLHNRRLIHGRRDD